MPIGTYLPLFSIKVCFYEHSLINSDFFNLDVFMILTASRSPLIEKT